MKTLSKRLFAKLDTPLICEHKTAALPDSPAGMLHNHDGYEIFLLLKGSATFYGENGGFLLNEGDLLLISPFSFHRVEPMLPDCYERIFLNLTSSLITELSSPVTALEKCFTPSGRHHVHLLHLSADDLHSFLSLSKAIKKSLFGTAFGDDILLKAYVTQLLVMLNRLTLSDGSLHTAGVMPKIVMDTFAYIENHLTEEISLDILAKHLHHNGDYISRRFKGITGISLQQYIIAKRLTLAQHLLQKGLSPGEVCFQTGFHDYSNFSRTFRNHIGISPMQYIKQ